METRLVNKYIAKDGRGFDEPKDCLDYEAMLDAVGKYYTVMEDFKHPGVAYIKGVHEPGYWDKGHFCLYANYIVAVDGDRLCFLDSTLRLEELIEEIPPEKVRDALADVYLKAGTEKINECEKYIMEGKK